MATIMTKQGQLDNVVTYEHICDTVADMANINPSYVTLGSVCIVIKGENDDLEVYMADSKKEWKIISSSSGESGSISSSGIHICAQDEYDSVTGMPTIEDPLSNTFYLTPGGSETNDLYNEWIWLEDDEEWEKFGSATTAISQPDWNQSDSSANDFIKNKPAIRQQANGGILENNATDASGVRSHAEGESTTASGWASHAEGNESVASGAHSHAEGEGTEASGRNSHAEGCGTIAKCYAQHVFGEYNEEDPSNGMSGQYVEIVGNGDGFYDRSNARTLDWNGNEEVAGDVKANACGGANPISLIAVSNSVQNKLDKNQGAVYSGKFMGINNSGNIVPLDVEGGNIAVTEELISGEDYELSIREGETSGVVSVAGKTGTVTLNSNDVAFNDAVTYDNGTIGKKVSNLEDIILVQNNEPTIDENCIWIPTTGGAEVEVPDINEFNDLKSQINEIIVPSQNLYNSSDPDKFNGRIGGSGNPVYDNTLITTGFIPCSYAQIFYATRKNDSSSQRVAMSLNYAYIFDSNKVRIGNAINSPGSSFEITDSTAVYVRFTFYSSFSYPMIALSEDAEYMDYGTFSLDEDIKKNIVDDATRYTYNRVYGSIGVPINMIDGVYSDITVVSGKLVGFASANDALTNTAKIDIITFENGFDKQPTGTKTIYHSFGHCNTIDYSEINGCLILGNGSGDYSLPGKIYIIPKFAEIIENASQGDVLTLSGTNAVIIDCSAYNMGSKFNLVWGELNGRTAQIAYLITAKFGASQTDSDAGDNGTIYRIMLGLGTNNLGKGQFIPNAGNNDFNGTFAILDTYTQSGTNYDTCNQGTCFKNGSIISGIGHSGLWVWKMHTDYRNNGIWYEENKQYLYNPDGSLVSQQGTSGVCVTDNYIIIGQANVGTGIFKL